MRSILILFLVACGPSAVNEACETAVGNGATRFLPMTFVLSDQTPLITSADRDVLLMLVGPDELAAPDVDTSTSVVVMRGYANVAQSILLGVKAVSADGKGTVAVSAEVRSSRDAIAVTSEPASCSVVLTRIHKFVLPAGEDVIVRFKASSGTVRFVREDVEAFEGKQPPGT